MTNTIIPPGGAGTRDYNQAILRYSDEMVKAQQEGDVERLERLKAQWAYACELRDFYQQHPELAENNQS